MATPALPRGYQAPGVFSVCYRIVDYLGQFDLDDDAFLTNYRWEWFMESGNDAEGFRVRLRTMLQEEVATHPAWPSQTAGRRVEILARLADFTTIPGLAALRARAKEMAMAYNDKAAYRALMKMCVHTLLARLETFLHRAA